MSDTTLFAQGGPLPRDDGYRGIWFHDAPTGDEYRYLYSGGLATYPQQHVPIACHARAVGKTFFCYGGRPKDVNQLLHAISYYDHALGVVPRPAILLQRHTDDAHDNPTMSLDANGFIWIFSNSHGTGRPSYIHRSARPYGIDAFDLVATTNFSYSQPWHVPGRGFIVLHTRYSPAGERRLFWMTSTDGVAWDEPQLLAHVEKGHYQVSWRAGDRIGTAFNYHPAPIGLAARTNLYYLQTDDMGCTWRTASGGPISPPLLEARNAALVHDYRAEGLLVYLKTVDFDLDGRPVILFITSHGHPPGPANGPRTWRTAHWTGERWDIRSVTTSGNNYDFGSLSVEADGTWRIIAPTEFGPQPYNVGGEMVLWTTDDEGATWTRVRQLTHGSAYNHSYARRPFDAHPDFYAFWADGHGRQPSDSRLYFTNRTGDHVWRLPPVMHDEFTYPEIAW